MPTSAHPRIVPCERTATRTSRADRRRLAPGSSARDVIDVRPDRVFKAVPKRQKKADRRRSRFCCRVVPFVEVFVMKMISRTVIAGCALSAIVAAICTESARADSLQPSTKEGGAAVELAAKDAGKSDFELAAKDAGKSNLELAAKDAGKSDFELAAKDAGKSNYELAAKDAGKSNYELAAKDAGKSNYELAAKDAGKSDFELAAKDAGKSNYELAVK